MLGKKQYSISNNAIHQISYITKYFIVFYIHYRSNITLYHLVIFHIANWKVHPFWSSVNHLFPWAIFHSKLLVYQRVFKLFFHFIYGMSSFPLTNIFQRGWNHHIWDAQPPGATFWPRWPSDPATPHCRRWADTGRNSADPAPWSVAMAREGIINMGKFTMNM